MRSVSRLDGKVEAVNTKLQLSLLTTDQFWSSQLPPRNEKQRKALQFETDVRGVISQNKFRMTTITICKLNVYGAEFVKIEETNY